MSVILSLSVFCVSDSVFVYFHYCLCFYFCLSIPVSTLVLSVILYIILSVSMALSVILSVSMTLPYSVNDSECDFVFVCDL